MIPESLEDFIPDKSEVMRLLRERIDEMIMTSEKVSEHASHSINKNTNSLSRIPYPIYRINSTEFQLVGAGASPHEYFGSSLLVSAFGIESAECDLLVGSYGDGRSGSPQVL